MGKKGMADPLHGKTLSQMGDIGMNNAILLLLLKPDMYRAPPCLFLPDLFLSLNELDLVLQ
jgi:hypothetical protein